MKGGMDIPRNSRMWLNNRVTNNYIADDFALSISPLTVNGDYFYSHNSHIDDNIAPTTNLSSPFAMSQEESTFGPTANTAGVGFTTFFSGVRMETTPPLNSVQEPSKIIVAKLKEDPNPRVRFQLKEDTEQGAAPDLTIGGTQTSIMKKILRKSFSSQSLFDSLRGQSSPRTAEESEDTPIEPLEFCDNQSSRTSQSNGDISSTTTTATDGLLQTISDRSKLSTSYFYTGRRFSVPTGPVSIENDAILENKAETTVVSEAPCIQLPAEDAFAKVEQPQETVAKPPAATQKRLRKRSAAMFRDLNLLTPQSM